MLFTHFSVTGLHNRTSLDVPIRDNKLVIIGENGSGKTTLMNLMYFFLSGQWHRLPEYQFAAISAQIDGQKLELRREELGEGAGITEDAVSYRRYSSNVQRRIKMLHARFAQMPASELTSADSDVIEQLSELHGIPRSLVRDEMIRFLTRLEGSAGSKLHDLRDALRNALRCQVLYLPTYRRIEQELQYILPDVDRDELRQALASRSSMSRENAYMELVEFGMTDVGRSLNACLEQLKEYAREQLGQLTLSYLREIIDSEYSGVDITPIRSIDEGTINSVLNRIDENVLPADEKQRLRRMIYDIRTQEQSAGQHAKIVGHFFLKLLALRSDQVKREAPVRDFVEICNRYLMPTKEYVYDDGRFDLRILLRHARSPDVAVEDTVALQHLSSGEKQIVSLFSHLILSENRRFFVLIDEPELSLSVPWQQRFLPDVANCGRTEGLIAVTHSPFTYENALDPYARGIEEFRR